MVVTEARVPAERVASVTGTFQRGGWNAVILPAASGPGGRPVGGFAVACRTPRKLFVVPRRVASATHANRWCHVMVEDGSPSGGFHLFPVYCHCRGTGTHLRLQADTLAQVFAEAAALGDVRAAVLGDFNSTPEESYFLRALGPSWVVLAQTDPRPTVVPSDPEAVPRRLDYAVANWPYALQASSEYVDASAPTRPHHVVSHVLQTVQLAARRLVVKPRRLAPDREEAHWWFEALASSYSPLLQRALAAKDVEGAWDAWCSWAEDALRGGLSGPGRRTERGRGLVVASRPATAKQARPEWGASTKRSRELLVAHRRLRALYHLRQLPAEKRRPVEEAQVLAASARSLLSIGAPWARWSGCLGTFGPFRLQVLFQDVGRSFGASLRDVARERAKGWRDF
ncbi:MAG: endonuclease/exonuclease/phosphatase family protein, partial [bacterium]|nr:endonuclease/exonuclease/phosphatase family protein [bacterium]